MLFKDLFLRCHDASVFQKKEHHATLSKVFFDDNNVNSILQSDQYFIIGEKGTGKTIIAQYMSNVRNDKNCSVLDFSSIDFQTFQSLVEGGHFKFIQMDQIWQVLLMAIAAEKVVERESIIRNSVQFNGLKVALDEFFRDRFKPEFPIAIEMLSDIERVSALANKHIGELRHGDKEKIKINYETGSSPLNSVRTSFAESFKSSRVTEDHLIFVDKIDIKPEELDYDLFINSLRSFVKAAIYLNEQVFSSMKGHKRIRFVMLLRPDIFDKLNLQNQSARVSDNSVVLNWDTTYGHHRGSAIFALADRFIGKQVDNSYAGSGEAWDTFIDGKVGVGRNEPNAGINKSFNEFLRVSWFRPRDIVRTLAICQTQPDCEEKVTREGFEKSRKQFSDYLYGEVKDFSRFYFSDNTFSLIERFFSELQSLDKIDYESFLRRHEVFVKKIKNVNSQGDIDPKIGDPDSFLQILYSSNIICWRSKDQYDGVDDYWAFRERTPAQLEPKVGLYCEYAVHYGLRRALRLNRSVVTGVQD